MKLCTFPDCGRPLGHSARYCAGHHTQYHNRGRDPDELTPLGKRGRPHRSDETTREDVDDYRMLRATTNAENALRRMGIGPEAIIRRYRQLGIKPPSELWTLKRDWRKSA